MATQMTLKNGTVITIKAVPSLTVLEMVNRLPAPRIPLWHNEEKQRDEENPNDPDYLQAVKDYNSKLQDKTVDAFLLYGVQVDEVGPNCLKLEDDTWLENAEYLLDMTVAKSGAGRRAAWLKHHVFDEATELGDVITAVSIASGLVTEEQVEQAANSFRDNQTGDTNTTVPPTSNGELGDTADFAPRDGDGVRVQGDSQVQLKLVD